MAWKQGPLPKDTWNWGGVVPVGEDLGYGFYFADFCGDHAKIVSNAPEVHGRVLKPEEVAWYDNGLTIPPGESGVTGRAGA